MAKTRSNKNQGSSVNGASMGSDNTMRMPQMLERGLGTSFAMAVSRAMDGVASLSGSKNGFLGVEKTTIDPTEYAHSLLKSK